MFEIHPYAYPIFSIITGILILVFPALLNYVVAVYLILIGIMGLVGSLPVA
jgi:hypothetical protein